jgi:hypothetical protein
MLDTKNEAQTTSLLDGMQDAFQGVVKALGERALDTAKQKISDATDALTDVASGSGTSDSENESGVGGFRRVLAGVEDKAKAVMSDVQRRRRD